MSLDGFSAVVRGSLILRWSPSGELDKYVVIRPNIPVTVRHENTAGPQPEMTTETGHAIGQVHEDGTITIDGGDTVLLPELVEQEEAFGYTYIFTSGESFKFPDWLP